MANYVDDILLAIDQTSENLVSRMYGALGAELGIFIPTALVILMIIFGLAMMLGHIQYPVRKFIGNTVVVTLVFTVITNWDWFNVVFYNMFTNSPDAIGGLIMTAAGFETPGGTGTRLGELFEMGLVASGAGFSSDGYFMPIVIGTAIFLATLLVCGFAIALLCLAKIGMAVVLALGPLFIFFTLFSVTRGMFSSWLQQCFNYGFIALLTYVILAFLMQLLLQALIAVPDTNPTVDTIAPLCIVSFIGCFVLWQVPQTAAGLAGGAQLTTMGVFGSAGRQLSMNRMFKGGNRSSVNTSTRFQTLKNIYERARRGSIRKT